MIKESPFLEEIRGFCPSLHQLGACIPNLRELSLKDQPELALPALAKMASLRKVCMTHAHEIPMSEWPFPEKIGVLSWTSLTYHWKNGESPIVLISQLATTLVYLEFDLPVETLISQFTLIIGDLKKLNTLRITVFHGSQPTSIPNFDGLSPCRVTKMIMDIEALEEADDAPYIIAVGNIVRLLMPMLEVFTIVAPTVRNLFSMFNSGSINNIHTLRFLSSCRSEPALDLSNLFPSLLLVELLGPVPMFNSVYSKDAQSSVFAHGSVRGITAMRLHDW